MPCDGPVLCVACYGYRRATAHAQSDARRGECFPRHFDGSQRIAYSVAWLEESQRLTVEARTPELTAFLAAALRCTVD